MPDLPAIAVTQAQYDRLAQVLPGATASEKVAAYKKGTLGFWRRQVIDADIRAAEEAAAATLEAARAAALGNPNNV